MLSGMACHKIRLGFPDGIVKRNFTFWPNKETVCSVVEVNKLRFKRQLQHPSLPNHYLELRTSFESKCTISSASGSVHYEACT